MKLLLAVIIFFSLGIDDLSVATGKQSLNRAERRLIRAIAKNKSAARLRALAKQVDVNFTFKDFPVEGISGTPLIIAAMLGTYGSNSEFVKVLVEEGADANFAYNGETPLHYMFQIYPFVWTLDKVKNAYKIKSTHNPRNHTLKRFAMIEQLVALGADLDAFNHHGETPFMYSIMGVSNYGTSTIEVMLELGANPLLKKKDNDGNEYDVFEMRRHGALHNELTNFYRPQLRDLVVSKMQERLMMQRTDEQAILDEQLLEAVINNAPLVDVKKLLERGAHPDRAIGEDGGTVLHIAARQGQVAKVNLLLDYQANVRVKDNDDNLPFDYSAQGETTEHWLIASILLEKMFNSIDARDNKGWTVVNWALVSGDYQRISELLADGVDLTKGTQDAFEIVETLQDQRMLDLLLEYHDSNVDTFLLAARKGLVWVGQQLINRGVNVNSANPSGTALLKATIHEQLEFIHLLIANGVDLAHTDLRGENAASYARAELYRRQSYGQRPVGRMKDILDLLEGN